MGKGKRMIDSSSIKNKSKIVIEHNGKDITVEVVESTLNAATVILPDGSHCDVPHRTIKSIANAEPSNATAKQAEPKIEG